jgi:flagellar basal body P-ring protein FlgI
MEDRLLRPFHTNRREALAAIGTVALLAGADKEKTAPKLASAAPQLNETVGDWAVVIAQRNKTVEGVGLVVGLNGTGSDPEPGVYREDLLEQMRKAGVDGPNKILASPNTSLVIVKATIPPGIAPSDPLDVSIELTPNSGTTSLEGGFLMRTQLREVLMTDKDIKEGFAIASAFGPVLTGDAKNPDNLKAGRVPGGARVKKEVPYRLALLERHQSIRSAAILQEVINKRFAVRIGPESRGVATAKTDEYLELKVPQVYHQNQARFFQVIKLLPLIDRPELRQNRIEKCAIEISNPKTAGIAALKLEGLGPAGVEVLEKNLANKDAQCRFFAAEALAYLQKESGVEVLRDSALKTPEFRAFALAALAAADQPAAMVTLRQLMGSADPVIRYGAFAALRTADPENPYLGRVAIMKEKAEDAPVDNMAAAIVDIQSRRRRGSRLDEPFELYAIDCDGPPMVHYTRSNRAEIVIFGGNQKLEPPIVLGGGGSIIINASESDQRAEISRITRNNLDSGSKVLSSLALRDIVRETANLGATYPEIIQLLESANRQHNLQGTLMADARPDSSMDYTKAQIAGKKLGEPVKKDAAVGRASAVKEDEETEEKPTRVFKLPKFRLFNREGSAEETPLPKSDPAEISKIPKPRTKPGLSILNRMQSPPRLPNPND